MNQEQTQIEKPREIKRRRPQLRLPPSMAFDISNQDRLITRKDAAAMLGVAEGTMAIWAKSGQYAIPFIKIGSLVRYKLSEIKKFMDRRTVSRGEPIEYI